MFVFRDRAERVEVAFTSARSDGRAFNLARPGTAPASIGDPMLDLASAVEALGADRACGMVQVHGAAVAEAPVGSHASGDPEVDGLVTTTPGLALVVRVADCVPVLLADAAAGVVGAAHAGRLGVELDVVGATVSRMRALGATEICAWIGPHVCGGCYEVPEAMRDQVAAVVPATRATTTKGTPSLDLAAGVRAQLDSHRIVDVVEVGRCTMEDPEL